MLRDRFCVARAVSFAPESPHSPVQRWIRFQS